MDKNSKNDNIPHKSLFSSALALFKPRYRLEYDNEGMTDVKTFYRKSSYLKALSEQRRKERIEKAKKDGTFFRFAMPLWAVREIRDAIYNLNDSETVFDDGKHIEYISPSGRHVWLRVDDCNTSTVVMSGPQEPPPKKPTPTHLMVTYVDENKKRRNELFLASNSTDAVKFQESHADSNLWPIKVTPIFEEGKK